MRTNNIETTAECKHGSEMAIMCNNSLAAERKPNFGVKYIAAFLCKLHLGTRGS